MAQFSTISIAPVLRRTPFRPNPPMPLNESERRMITSLAPAKVLQGAVRLHGLTSSPTPETHVRVACACASDPSTDASASVASVFSTKLLMMRILSFSCWVEHLEKSTVGPSTATLKCANHLPGAGERTNSGSKPGFKIGRWITELKSRSAQLRAGSTCKPSLGAY